MIEQLKSCPFCDARLEMRGKYFAHPRGKCILSGHHFKSGFIGQWNKRVPDAALSAEVEMLALVKTEMHSAAMEAVARAEAAEARVAALEGAIPAIIAQMEATGGWNAIRWKCREIARAALSHTKED